VPLPSRYNPTARSSRLSYLPFAWQPIIPPITSCLRILHGIQELAQSCLFAAWRPRVLVEHGDQQLSVAAHLLASYGPELDQPRHNQARSLVDYADDIKHTLNNKHFLTRIKPAGLHARNASEALEMTKAMPVLRALPPDTLNRPTRG